MSLDKSIRDQYRVVIGLEVHAQLLTESKLFCSDSTSFGASPNTHISPISLGHPGTLPKLNKKAVDYAIKMGLACECKITEENILPGRTIFIPICPRAIKLHKTKPRFAWEVKCGLKQKAKLRKRQLP